ncbi:hypothetical protein Csa_023046 [Cucumis sativus]|nr:hypothetical protein Csa_023046 [Cucumis sativus]
MIERELLALSIRQCASQVYHRITTCCVSFESTRLMGASFGSTRLMSASFGSTKLMMSVPFGNTRPMCILWDHETVMMQGTF